MELNQAVDDGGIEGIGSLGACLETADAFQDAVWEPGDTVYGLIGGAGLVR